MTRKLSFSEMQTSIAKIEDYAKDIRRLALDTTEQQYNEDQRRYIIRRTLSLMQLTVNDFLKEMGGPNHDL